MSSGAQFRPPRPGGYLSKTQMLRSGEYAAQSNEVKQLGKSDSKARTKEQEEIALFWANDLDGTYKPPGQLFEITKTVSAHRGWTSSITPGYYARLFALVALAMGNAAIVAWDAKYSTDLDLWRPETAIQLADTDGNKATSKTADWQPLSRDTSKVRFSPPFPAYVSGHATFGAAHAAVMRLYFGTDNVTFTATTRRPTREGCHPHLQQLHGGRAGERPHSLLSGCALPVRRRSRLPVWHRARRARRRDAAKVAGRRSHGS